MKTIYLKLTLALFAGLFITSCDSDDPVIDTPDTNLAAMLQNEATNVITATYQTLDNKANTLSTQVAAFAAQPDATTLAAARQAWSETRMPWEQSEGFLFGPVDTQGLDPAMDTWPVDINAMNAILESDVEITPEVLSTNLEARGFHLIEYLLWGVNGTKTADQFSARELEYLQAAAQDLNNNTTTLYDGWKSTGGNYQANFINAGNTGSIYTSEKTAMMELIEGMITIADEVGNGKIADPLNEGGDAMPNLEESRFSHNSKADFVNNIKSIQNVYLGNFMSHEGLGISDVIVANNASLDTEIKAAITDAINAIEAIPGTFTSAITNNRAEVIEAKTKVNYLHTLIENQLKPYVQAM